MPMPPRQATPLRASPFERLNDCGSRVVLATLRLHHGHQQPLTHGLEDVGSGGWAQSGLPTPRKGRKRGATLRSAR